LLAGCADRTPAEPAPSAPNVILIVLDNVRADRLSLCGYQRPTSPVLDQLCARGRASCTCGAQAPSSWTLPTHASYFTGVEVPEHGAGQGGEDDKSVILAPGTSARPLDDRLPTLAERFAERGYQTVAVSGNPLISPPSGLTRGFEVVEHATGFGSLAAVQLRNLVRERLRQLDPMKPLFLFVNIAEAHRPWLEIPDGVGWVPPRPHMSFAAKGNGPNSDRRKYVAGTLRPNYEARMLAQLADVYDWAVWRADHTLDRILKLLRNTHWVGGERPFRVVIVSDHGEHLGEHRLLGHAGPYLFEELTRVPLAVFSSERPPDLPEQISALATYDLLLDGRLRRRPVRAAAFASATWQHWYGPEVGGHPAAAVWQGTHKTVHHDGRIVRYDLATDPGETAPEDWSSGPEVEELDALVRSLEAVAAGEPLDPKMTELLKTLGYL
jgi:arylsulfatase A-like enzyme